MVKKMGNQLFFFKWNQAPNNCLSLSDSQTHETNSEESPLCRLNAMISSLQNRNDSYSFSWREGGSSSRHQWPCGFLGSETYSLEWRIPKGHSRKRTGEKNQFKLASEFFFHGRIILCFRILFRDPTWKRENRIYFESGRVRVRLGLLPPTIHLSIPGNS